MIKRFEMDIQQQCLQLAEADDSIVALWLYGSMALELRVLKPSTVIMILLSPLIHLLMMSLTDA